MKHSISTINSNQTTVRKFFDIKEIEVSALHHLSSDVYDFFSGGAGDEDTLHQNIVSFDKIKVLPRVLRNVESRSLATIVLGNEIAFPLLIAPMAFQKLAHPDGEIAVAKGAHEANVLMTLSTLSTSSFEQVKCVGQMPIWFQLYIYKDREITKNLIQQAEQCGFNGLVLTVDAPLYGKRKREIVNPLRLTKQIQLDNLQKAGLDLNAIDLPQLAPYLASLLDPSITWKDIEWIRSISSLPIILKGVMNPRDVEIAHEYNIDALIISNHGGRQFDSALSAIEALLAISEVNAGKTELILDGGIRRGSDILKAIALGAKAVMVGRPILWGLAAGGVEGVTRVLSILKSELDMAMALCGCKSIEEVNKDILFLKK